MKIKTFVEKGVLAQMAYGLNAFSTIQEKIDAAKIIDIANFINKSDEWTCDGLLDFNFSDPANKDLLTLLASNGKLPTLIPDSSTFAGMIEHAEPFGLCIFNSESYKMPSSIPSYSLNELIQVTKDKDKHYEPIISEEEPYKVFRQHAYLHKINSVIINDRFFLACRSPHVVLSKLLGNYINTKQSGKVIVTIFYTERPSIPIEEVNPLMIETLAKFFPKFTIQVELVHLEKIDENHDRLMFTDFLCCHSGHSFTFLNSRRRVATSFHRYMLIDTNNFSGNLKYLDEFLGGVKKLIPGFKTNNQIIITCQEALSSSEINSHAEIHEAR